ncbi:MAG: glycosyltransferase family 4 protein [Nitrospirota bacterium]
MKQIKICFISLFAYPLFNPEVSAEFGGAELQLYYLATELAKDPQFEIIFITGDFGQPGSEIRAGVKIYKLFSSSKTLRYIRTILEYIRLWLLLKEIDADVYIQRAAGIITGLIALFCRLDKKKFIYMTAHDNDVVTDRKPAWMPSGILGNFIWWGFKRGLKTAGLVVVQHQAQKENLKRYYKKEGYIRQSAHRITEVREAPSKEFILWIARCEEWKQPELFIELARTFFGEKFIMVCPVSNDVMYFEEIKSLAAQLSNLEFIDYVPFNGIDDYFLKAKIFINTSRDEGFPNTFIQAFKSRTPVLSMNVNPDGILEKFDIGRCANGRFEQLKIGLENLLKDNQLWQKLSQNAYEYAESKHNIKKIIEADKKMILKLLNTVH